MRLQPVPVRAAGDVREGAGKGGGLCEIARVLWTFSDYQRPGRRAI